MTFSSTSFAQWTKVGENTIGDTYYVDFERIRKHDGYVYYWDLSDYLKPTEQGLLSSKMYTQGDCNLFRLKGLSFVHHFQSMGRDTGVSNSPKNPEWVYPGPGSVYEIILNQVCSR